MNTSDIDLLPSDPSFGEPAANVYGSFSQGSESEPSLDISMDVAPLQSESLASSWTTASGIQSLQHHQSSNLGREILEIARTLPVALQKNAPRLGRTRPDSGKLISEKLSITWRTCYDHIPGSRHTPSRSLGSYSVKSD